MSSVWFSRHRDRRAESSNTDDRPAGSPRRIFVSSRARRVALAATSVAAVVAALLASPASDLLGGNAKPAGLAASVTAQRKASLAGSKVELADSACAQPDSAKDTARAKPSGVPAVGAPSAPPMGSEEGSVVSDLLSTLGGDAFTFADNRGFGWILNLLGGGQSNVDAGPDPEPAQRDQLQAGHAVRRTSTRIARPSCPLSTT